MRALVYVAAGRTLGLPGPRPALIYDIAPRSAGSDDVGEGFPRQAAGAEVGGKSDEPSCGWMHDDFVRTA